MVGSTLGNVMVGSSRWWGLGSSRWWGLLAMDIRTKGRVERWIEPPVCPTYSRGPFIRSVQNIANMYCTECIIGIVQNAGTPSRLRFARTRRDEVIPVFSPYHAEHGRSGAE